MDDKSPWEPGASLFEHVRRHISEESGRLRPEGRDLPDEDPARDGLRYAPGLAEGLTGFESEPGERVERTERALRTASRDPSAAALAALYEELLRGPAAEIVDPLLDRIVRWPPEEIETLAPLSRRIAGEAPDREPVKVAVALLGLAGGLADGPLLLTLGTHPEFSLYAGVALANLGLESYHLELLGRSTGWGRVHLVRRLPEEIESPELRDWLLREGWRTELGIDDHIALDCAERGRLAEALSGEPDDELLLASLELLAELVPAGTPFGDMTDLEDAPRTLRRVVDLLEEREPRSLEVVLAVDALGTAMASEAVPGEQLELREMAGRCRTFLASRDWSPEIDAAWDAKEGWKAHTAARTLGVDDWTRCWTALRVDPSPAWLWDPVMEGCPLERLHEVLAHAREHLPWGSTAGGPAQDSMLGEDYAALSALCPVLIGLGRHPGRGADLLAAGLRSRFPAHRRSALEALESWERAPLDEPLAAVLERTAGEEPDEELRRRMQSLVGTG